MNCSVSSRGGCDVGSAALGSVMLFPLSVPVCVALDYGRGINRASH